MTNTTPATETRTTWVRDYNLPVLRKGIDRLNRRAARIGVPGYTLTVLGQRVREVSRTNADGSTTKVGVAETEVAVAGEPVRFAGWTFAATIQHLGEEAGNILRVAPAFQGEQVPADYRRALPVCDHCRAARRRLDTYVLRHEDGTWKQVGSTCIQDFLGGDAAKVVARAELAFDLDALMSGDPDAEAGDYFGMRERNLLPCGDFLAWVCAVARAYGFVTRKAADGQGFATADRALTFMFKAPEYRRDDDPKPDAQDHALAAEIVEWGRGLAERADRDMNEYLWNLRAAFASEWVPYNAAGLVASAYSAFSREREREVIQRKRAAESKHVGTVGERSVMTLTVTALRSTEGAYGVTTLVSFVDESGAVVKWFASGDKTSEFVVGATYRGKVTVKKHDEWQGAKQTLVTRCALSLVPPVPSAS